MVNPKQLNSLLHTFKVEEGNKLTVYALKGEVEMIVKSDAEPFVSQSSIIRAARPKDIPLAVSNYGKMVSSPMGNNVTATVRLARDLVSKEEFLRQMLNLYEMAFESNNITTGNNSNTTDNA